MAKISGMGGGSGPYEETPEEAAQWAALNQVMVKFPKGTGKVFRFVVQKMRGQKTVPNDFPGAKKKTRDIFQWTYLLDDARYPALLGLRFFAKTGTNLHEKGALLPLFVATMQRQPTDGEVGGDFDTDDIVGHHFNCKLEKGEVRTIFANGVDTKKPDTSRGGVNYWLGEPEVIVGDDGPVEIPRADVKYDTEGIVYVPTGNEDSAPVAARPATSPVYLPEDDDIPF